jgi:tetratricopeptide (TPR) repeat protein
MLRARAISCIVLLICLATGVWFRCALAADQGPNLPDLPQLAYDKMLSTVRAEVQKAYDIVLAHPRDATANGNLGMVLHAHDLPSEAEMCYRRAHLLAPTSFRWTYYLGMVQVDQRNCSAAIPTFLEAQRLDPNHLATQLRMGECFLVSSQWDEAGKLYQAIVQSHPENAEAYYGLGRVRAARDDFSGAIESIHKACELFPKFAAAHFALARAYRRLGKSQEAQQELELSNKSEGGIPDIDDPLLAEVAALNRDFKAYLNAGVKSLAAGRLQDAADAFEGALEINPQLPEAHTHLIYVYGQLGQAAKAEEHYRAAVRLDPKGTEAYFNYGVFLLAQRRPADTEEAFRKTLEINPRYAEAHSNLGYLLESEGRSSEAVAEYRKALEIKPDFIQANFSLGRILLKEERFEEGIPLLLKALRTEDEDAKTSYLYAVGIAFADVGDLENGLRYLRLARDRAEVRKQASLLTSIADDLRLLESGTSPQ